MTAINYPERQSPATGARQLRFGEHRDRSCFTILSTTGPGLQVQSAAVAWEPIEAVPGTLLVNAGSMLADWTGRRWVSPMHRVVHGADGSGRCARRQTLVFFNPAHDVPLDALPLPEAGRSPLSTGPSLTVADYLRSMLDLYR